MSTARTTPYSEEIAGFREHYVENVEHMFAAVSDLYAKYWNDYFHFALFERGDETWEEAFEATHRRYMQALRIAEARDAADLACGRGGFAHVLAQHTDGKVLGIDLSQAQLSRCARFEGPNLRFLRWDIMALDRLDATFDAISFLDADAYLPDKRLAIERIAGVLRPGGRLLMVSWCKADGLNAMQESTVLAPFMRYWGIPSLETAAGYRRSFARSGLHLIEESDLNALARRNWDYGYEQALNAVRELNVASAAKLLWKGVRLGPEGLRLLKEQFHAALYIKAGFDAGFLRYSYFVAEKR